MAGKEAWNVTVQLLAAPAGISAPGAPRNDQELFEVWVGPGSPSTLIVPVAVSVTYERPDEEQHRIDLDLRFPDDSHLMFSSGGGRGGRGPGRLEALIPEGVLKEEGEHVIVVWIDQEIAGVHPFVVRMTTDRRHLLS